MSYSINILCWAGWYRESKDDYKAIFIKKHLDIISEFAQLHCFHIIHKKNLFWFKKYVLNESFGDITIYQIPSFFPLKQIGYLFIPFLEAYKAKKKFKQINVFHMHISYPFAAFTYLIELFKIKKWVLTEHWSGYTNFDNSFDKLNFLIRFLIKRRLKRFDNISVVSEFLKNQLTERFLFLKNKIQICSNPISYPNELKRLSDIQNNFKLLSISNLFIYPKNILFLLNVIKEVSKDIPNIQLYVYGDGKDKELFLQEAQKLGLMNTHIFYKGKVTNDAISEVYTQHHAFILLSRFETFSVVTAEAIAHGLPVIVSKCGGPEEYVNNQNGYLLPINDLHATVQAIIHLYQNYHLFPPQKVQSTILNKFDKQQILQQFKQLLL